jgi:hypothetical protein
MIVSQKMQDAMHHHVCPMRAQRFALFACFTRNNRCTNSEVAQWERFWLHIAWTLGNPLVYRPLPFGSGTV